MFHISPQANKVTIYSSMSLHNPLKAAPPPVPILQDAIILKTNQVCKHMI
jgi:hypothetical protein